MPDLSSEKQKPATIKMLAEPAFKSRFDDAREFKGWSMQTTLERILEEWISRIEVEMRKQGKLAPRSNTSLEK